MCPGAAITRAPPPKPITSPSDLLTDRLTTLCEALSGHGGDPERVCDRAMRAMTARGSKDDIALPAMHADPPSGRVR
ncbi:hypothetical protein ABGB18_08435 [Nonomuraea sp. B12E4]|uniref:hypothetical protein n=1 Tax=Nonomuraea sp. B12E4 TaxID=3153564 RepID=UPI00325D2F3D